MFQMVGVFAEFERAMIQERVRAGLDRAKAQGKTLGRPTLDQSVTEAILKDKDSGLSMRQIQRKRKVSLGAVHKVINAQARQNT